jgi:hypothetical protein
VLTLALLPFHRIIPPLLNNTKSLIWVKKRVMKGFEEEMINMTSLI